MKTERNHEQQMAHIDFCGFLGFTAMGGVMAAVLIPTILGMQDNPEEWWPGFIFGVPGFFVMVFCLIRAVHWWRLSRPTPPDPNEQRLQEWKEASRRRRDHQLEMSREWQEQFTRLASPTMNRPPAHIHMWDRYELSCMVCGKGASGWFEPRERNVNR